MIGAAAVVPEMDVTAYRKTYFALCRALAIPDDVRHEFNAAFVGKPSTTRWSVGDWRAAVAELQRRNGQNVQPSRPHLRGGKDRATASLSAAQLEYISKLAAQLTWKTSVHAFIRARLLHPFRREHWDGKIESLTAREAGNVITALIRMVSSKGERENVTA